MQISVAALCALFIATLWLSLSFRINNERQRVIDAAQQQTDNIARLFEEHVLRTLAAASVTLKQLETEYKRQGKWLDLAQYLRDRQPELEPYTILSVVDEEGNLILNNVPSSTPHNVRHLDNTQFHMRNATQDVFISKPRLGVLTGRPTIFLTRRMNKADGSFGGNTGVGMNPQYFSRFYDQIDLGPDASVLLVGRDGVIRARRSSKNSDVAQDISRSPLFTTHLPLHSQGHFRAQSPLDGITRLISYRAVKGYPLVVLVGMSEAVVLARFEQDKRIYLWWASGVSLVILAFAAMVLFHIAHRERANERLEASEERFALAVRGANDGIWDRNFQTHEAYISPRWKEIVGYRDDELPNIESSFFDRIHPDDMPRAKEAIDRHLENGEPYRVELRLRHKDGSYRWIVTRGEAVRDENGRPLRMVGSITDISARKGAEVALRESEERLRLALHAAGQGLYDLDVTTGDAKVSPEYAAMIGYDPATFEETNAKWAERLHPDDREKVYATYSAYIRGEIPSYEVEFRQKTKLGDWLWTLSIGSIVSRDANGKPLRMLGTHTDITARKRAEEQIKNSLQEKETLLKEIHHRVKNNLQIISSLLYLHSSSLRDPAARQALKESQDRVHSMGLVHEQLYRSSNFRAIDFGKHLKELTANIASSYGAINPRVRVETELESVAVDLDLAIPVSLIFNEILTNAFLHAFPGERAGKIQIAFHRDGSDNLILRVSDSGVGLPENLDWENGSSLGLKIVRNLAAQIHGELYAQSAAGVTTFQLSFSDSAEKPGSPFDPAESLPSVHRRGEGE